MKIILSLCVLFSTLLLSQPESTILREMTLLPASSGNEFNYSFRIPYNQLVFEKVNGSFSAAYEILIEVSDESGTLIRRSIKDKDVSVATYEETNSRNLYSEALFTTAVPEGKIEVNSVITDLKASKELRFPSQEIQLSTDDFLPPLVVYERSAGCRGNQGYRLANFEGSIPFSEENYLLIIPSKGEYDQIKVELTKGDSVYWKGNVKEKINGRLSIKECDGVFLNIDDSDPLITAFIVKNAAAYLPEGKYIIKIIPDGAAGSIIKYEIQTKWYDRPYSLNDPEKAIKALKYMKGDETVSTILKNKKANYREALTAFWQKYDPTPGSSFNPLMKEFYERIDYAARNFASVLKKDGVNTARGMIFIKYGKPMKVERSYNQYGKITETWLYQTNKFIFVDEKGTGEFLLLEG
jgi:GWxTD domain-containing protein